MLYFNRYRLGLLLVAMWCSNVDAQHTPNRQKPPEQWLAPGYSDLDFPAPAPGSYTLPDLGPASDARVLNTNGEYTTFHRLFDEKYTVLNFFYGHCSDINGCPVSHVVFSRIQRLAAEMPQFQKNIQLISMSFDPDNDTPETLRSLSHTHQHHAAHHDHTHHEHSAVQRHYLTAGSVENLLPILKNYNQSIFREPEENRASGQNISHILRAYLIDPQKRIRNIYSVSFLHPDIILNDIETLMLANQTKPISQTVNNTQHTGHISDRHSVMPAKDLSEKSLDLPIRIGPGDDKTAYHSKGYKTHSLSLLSRNAKQADLMALIKQPPLGLPPVPIPTDNPISSLKIQLGKKLFFDRRLSLNSTLSCAMCHIPEQGFTNNELKQPVGFEGRLVRRNTPSLFNVAYYPRLFFDARETSLENQVWQPLLAGNEMAMPSIAMVITRLRELTDYKGLFEQAFNGKQADIQTIGQAIASYQRALLSANSAFDRWFFGNQKNALRQSAKLGFELFRGKAACINCHSIERSYALFTDGQLHNTGIGWHASMKKPNRQRRIQVAPGHFVALSATAIQNIQEAPIADLGYYEITQNPTDRWRYRTPGLRNVALTAPYMHDGSLSSLEQVIDYYNRGGYHHSALSPLIKPLHLSNAEKRQLTAFLQSLTGDNIEQLIADALATPVGDTGTAP